MNKLQTSFQSTCLQKKVGVRVDEIKAKIETLTQEFDAEREELYDKLAQSEGQGASLQSRFDWIKPVKNLGSYLNAA